MSSGNCYHVPSYLLPCSFQSLGPNFVQLICVYIARLRTLHLDYIISLALLLGSRALKAVHAVCGCVLSLCTLLDYRQHRVILAWHRELHDLLSDSHAHSFEWGGSTHSLTLSPPLLRAPEVCERHQGVCQGCYEGW